MQPSERALALDDPVRLAAAARIVRIALARKRERERAERQEQAA